MAKRKIKNLAELNPILAKILAKADTHYRKLSEQGDDEKADDLLTDLSDE